MRAVALLTLLAATPVLAQEASQKTAPAWKLRADNGTATVVADPQLEVNRSDTVRLVVMPPGWHITTGPAIITWDPSWQASGTYRVELESFLFPGERQEGFGLFVGGTDLEGPGQRYLYVLLRKNGEIIVKRRDGAETATIVPWLPHPAIVPQTEGTAKNVLAIEVTSDSVRIFVNHQRVSGLPRLGLPTDGQVGLRVNHMLNVHVTRVDITKQ